MLKAIKFRQTGAVLILEYGPECAVSALRASCLLKLHSFILLILFLDKRYIVTAVHAAGKLLKLRRRELRLPD